MTGRLYYLLCKRIAVSITSLLMLCMHANAQTDKTEIDSLQKILPAIKNDTDYLNVVNKLVILYRTNNSDSGMHYAYMELDKAKRTGIRKFISRAYHDLGRAYLIQSKDANTVENLLASLKIAEADSDYKMIGANRFFLTLVNEKNKSSSENIEAYLLALDAARKGGDLKVILWIHTNLIRIYQTIGDTQEVARYTQETKWVLKELNDRRQEALSILGIAGIFAWKKQPDSALIYYKIALNYFEKRGEATQLAQTYNSIGDIYAFNKKQYELAISYWKKAETYAIPVKNIGMLINITRKLASVYSFLKDYKQAFEAQVLAASLSDSMLKRQEVHKATELQLKSDFEKKTFRDSMNAVRAQELNSYKLKQQKTYTYAGLAGVALLSLLSVMVFRNYRNQKRSNVIISKEKQRSEDLLLNILPQEVAEELKVKGSTEARQFDEVTVLFTDFVNFTTTSEKLGPTALVAELHNCFKAFDEIIARHDIEKIKTIGDAYLAVCGLPIAEGDHALKIAAAAIEIRDFMLQRRIQLGDATFGIRVGIHSGSVVAGIVGVKKFAYDIWGDTVNTAARMEQNSENGKINISDTSFELIKHKFHCIYRGELPAKNKGHLKMYFLEHEKRI